MSERVAVIICTRDRPAMLADALDATLPTLRAGDELLVVDSASSGDETAAVARARDARVVRAERKGLSRARNLGVAETAAPLVVFTDDDCRPQAGWLEHLASPFAASEVGFVLGQVRADVDNPHLPFDAARRNAMHAPLPNSIGSVGPVKRARGRGRAASKGRCGLSTSART
jgi:glycosyltransferase involved in cell wall biosynthesis